MSKSTHTAIFPSPLGTIGIVVQNDKLTHLEFLPDSSTNIQPQNKYSEKVITQLNQYFANPLYEFTINFHVEGTAFQQTVWRALQNISSGEILTYGMLAKKLKTGPRAIGQACRTNRIPLIIPCHRIVATNHKGGYAGTTNGRFMEIKTWLLKHELN
jgi:methylated-DNA-[protein]-cysteine S-methyltransferase